MNDIFELYTNENDCADLDMEAAAQRLSAAIQCRTIHTGCDFSAFDALQVLMRRSYPRVMAAGSFELVGHSVLITLPGSDKRLRPALFMSHQDVVPIVAGTESDWRYAPFAGVIAEGYIWGRGTLDIKQQVFGILEAAEYLLRHGAALRRTMYFAFGEDEETFNTGSKAISDLLKERGVELEFLLDEGGGKLQSGEAYGAPGVLFSQVDLAEKGYADLELRVESAGGHSSRPFGGTSLGILSEAIANISRSPFPAALHPALTESFLALAPYITEEPLHTLISDIAANSDALAGYCLTQKSLFPLVTTTIAPTMITGGSAACNVMPQNMSAVINFRIAIGSTAAEVLAHCQRAVADNRVHLRFLQANDASALARTDGLGYRALVQSMRRYYDRVVIVPSITVGATDARNYEQICDTCLRCSPFMGDEEDVARGVHGTDERLSLRSYAQGIRVLIDLMSATCL